MMPLSEFLSLDLDEVFALLPQQVADLDARWQMDLAAETARRQAEQEAKEKVRQGNVHSTH